MNTEKDVQDILYKNEINTFLLPLCLRERQMTSWHVMRLVKIFLIDVPISLPSCTRHDSHTTAASPVNRRLIDFHDEWCVCVSVCKMGVGFYLQHKKAILDLATVKDSGKGK